MSSRETDQREQVFFRISGQLRSFRVNTHRHPNDLCVLGVIVFGVELVENRPDKGSDHFSDPTQALQGMVQEMKQTALPSVVLQGDL